MAKRKPSTVPKFCVRQWAAATDGPSKRAECYATKAEAEAAMHRLYRTFLRRFDEDQIGGLLWFVVSVSVAPKGNPFEDGSGLLLEKWVPKGIKPLRDKRGRMARR